MYCLHPKRQAVFSLDRVEKVAIPEVQPILRQQLQKDRGDQQSNQQPRAPSRSSPPESRGALPEPREETPLIGSNVYTARHDFRLGECRRQRLPPRPQTTVPNSLPMPAVIPSANAPQNVTRAVARRMFAPPARAPIAPSSARKPSDAPDTTGTSAFVGDT